MMTSMSVNSLEVRGGYMMHQNGLIYLLCGLFNLSLAEDVSYVWRLFRNSKLRTWATLIQNVYTDRGFFDSFLLSSV